MIKSAEDIKKLGETYLARMDENEREEVIDYTYKRGSIKFLCLIAQILEEINAKTPDRSL